MILASLYLNYIFPLYFLAASFVTGSFRTTKRERLSKISAGPVGLEKKDQQTQGKRRGKYFPAFGCCWPLHWQFVAVKLSSLAKFPRKVEMLCRDEGCWGRVWWAAHLPALLLGEGGAHQNRFLW